MLQVIKIGENRFISRRLARDPERDMYIPMSWKIASRFSLAVCLQHNTMSIGIIMRYTLNKMIVSAFDISFAA